MRSLYEVVIIYPDTSADIPWTAPPRSIAGCRSPDLLLLWFSRCLRLLKRSAEWIPSRKSEIYPVGQKQSLSFLSGWEFQGFKPQRCETICFSSFNNNEISLSGYVSNEYRMQLYVSYNYISLYTPNTWLCYTIWKWWKTTKYTWRLFSKQIQDPKIEVR